MEHHIPRILLAGTNSGCGKTTVSCAVLQALVNRGLKVGAFKCGPDYIEALRGGCDIVTDTQMAKSGINKTILGKLGGEIHCFMSDSDVAEEAKARGITRAFVSMERAAKLDKPCIFAIGNAPTAPVSIKELMDAGKLSPALIIGVPVGFVNVVESKELIIASDARLCGHQLKRPAHQLGKDRKTAGVCGRSRPVHRAV